jgi:acyl carrier protein
MMDREALRATLLSLLEEEMGEAYDLLDDSVDLREGLGLDSIDVVGLIMRVERLFRIRLAMEELMEVKQVGQLLDLILGKLAARSSDFSSGTADLRSTAA